jgi:hypothetical protein
LSDNVRNTGIRRRKMEKKLSEKAELRNKRVRFHLDTPRTGAVSLAGDSNGCILVIPESFGMKDHITVKQGKLPEYPL